MTPDEMRATAKQLVQGAQKRIADATLTASEQVVIAVITDQVNAFTLASLADFFELTNPDLRKARAKRILNYNDALRKAAAVAFSKDDWSEFDKLIAAGLPIDGDAGRDGSP